jgi:hypothetical protein
MKIETIQESNGQGCPLTFSPLIVADVLPNVVASKVSVAVPDVVGDAGLGSGCN